MNVSEVFIRRPIATSLLMVGIALFGVIAYRALPVSDLPQVDYPTLNVSAGLPGGDPGTMASSVASPLERQFTTIAGPRLDDLAEQLGQHQHHAAVRPESRHRQRHRRRPDRDRRGDAAAAGGHAVGAVVPQEQPERSADSDAQPDVEHAAAVGARRLRGDDDRAAHLDGQRRVAGGGAGRVEVRRAGAARSRPPACAADRAQRDRHRAAELERQSADRPAVRADLDVQHQGGRAADERRRVPADRRQLPQGRAGAARPGRQRHRQHRERLQRIVVLHQAERPDRGAAQADRDHAAGDAPAGQQHHRGDGRGPRPAAVVRSGTAAVGAPHACARTSRGPFAPRSPTSR